MENDDVVREKIRGSLLKMVIFGKEDIFSGQEIPARIKAAQLLVEYLNYRDDGSDSQTEKVEEKLLNMVVEGRTGEQIKERVEAARLLLEHLQDAGGTTY